MALGEHGADRLQSFQVEFGGAGLEDDAVGVALVAEQAGELGKAENPYWAVLACPSCGSLGLITRQQCAGLEAMICGSSDCSAEYFLDDRTIRYRLAN